MRRSMLELPQKDNPRTPTVLFIRDEQQFELAFEDLRDEPRLAFDCETSGLDVRTDTVCLVQFATELAVYVLDVRPGAIPLQRIEPLLQRKLIGQNLKFDLSFMSENGLDVSGAQPFDCMIAHILLNAGLYSTQKTAGSFDFDDDEEDESVAARYRERHSLKTIAKEVLGVTLDKTHQTSNWMGELTDEQIMYAATDVDILWPLYYELGKRLVAAELVDVMKLEMRLLPAIVATELNGVGVDAAKWVRLAERAQELLVTAEHALNAEAGPVIMPGNPRATKKSGRQVDGPWPINWKSNPQVLHVFRVRGWNLENVTKDTLKEIAVDEPLAELLLDFRYATKRATTYGMEWVAKFVHPVTARVHSQSNQCGAEATGRMSSSKPNMQQIPNKPADAGQYKSCFVPRDGAVFCKADYSQIEPRIMAEFSKEPTFLDTYRQGGDLYLAVASKMYGLPAEEVNADQRKQAKINVLGFMYGMWWRRFRVFALSAYGLRLSEQEARANRESFFTANKALARHHEIQPDYKPEIRTRLGRRRLNVSSRNAMLNTPVQGTAADVMKLAMCLVYERAKQVLPSLAICLCVHDELVVEVDAAYAEQAKQLLIECMEEAFYEFLFDVPCKVDAAICSDWSGTPVRDHSALPGGDRADRAA